VGNANAAMAGRLLLDMASSVVFEVADMEMHFVTADMVSGEVVHNRRITINM
jgi:hypothetical protein